LLRQLKLLSTEQQLTHTIVKLKQLQHILDMATSTQDTISTMDTGRAMAMPLVRPLGLRMRCFILQGDHRRLHSEADVGWKSQTKTGWILCIRSC